MAKTGEEKFAVMKAFYEEDAPVKCRPKGSDIWTPSEFPDWDWESWDYEVRKPTTKELLLQSMYHILELTEDGSKPTMIIITTKSTIEFIKQNIPNKF